MGILGVAIDTEIKKDFYLKGEYLLWHSGSKIKSITLSSFS